MNKFNYSPFPYVQFKQFFTHSYASSLLEWFEDCIKWELKTTDFYQQYECNFKQHPVPQDIHFFQEEPFLNILRKEMGNMFHATFLPKIDITAHKMVKGHQIEIHNDFLPDEKCCRLVIYFNKRWQPNYGGELILFNSYQAHDVHKMIPPYHNTGIAFQINSLSLHEVKPLLKGPRYSLVYTFYEPSTPPIS